MRLKENHSGIILLIVLWILMILSMLAVGLGRRASIDIALTKYQIAREKTDYLAWGAFNYALNLVKKNSEETGKEKADTLYACGIRLKDGQTPENIFSNVAMGEGDITISYEPKGLQPPNRVYYGLSDEERKINLNALTDQNYKVLSHLIVLSGFSEEKAMSIAASAVDWKDTDSNVTHSPYGAEDNDYMSLSRPYHCKNMPFDSVEELMLVKGMASEIYDKIKNVITVFPQEEAGLTINIHTATDIVIKALARLYTGAMTNTETADADSLTEKILSSRRGEDGQEMTADDRFIEQTDLGLNAKENVIFLAMQSQMTKEARFLRMNIKARDKQSDIENQIEAVITRDDLSIIYWRRGQQ